MTTLPLSSTQSQKITTTSTRPLPSRKSKDKKDADPTPFVSDLRNDSDVLTEMIPAKNSAGSNSCFINVVFRVLYHSKIFRKLLLNYNQPKVHLFVQIQNLFRQYKQLQMQPSLFKSINAIDVSLIRKELSLLFQGYESGYSGDPIDVFLNIMTAVHSHKVNCKLSEDNSAVCTPLCPAHACFALKLQEEISCSQCKKKTSSVYDNNYYVYEVYIWEIMNTIKGKPFKEFNKLFFERILSVGSIVDNCVKFCKCPNQSTVSKAIILKENPPYLMLHMTWDSMSPPLADLCNIYAMIPLTANNDSLFKLSEKAVAQAYHLKSVIAFYNGHYTSSFKSIKENKWFFCDDMIIKEFNSWPLLMQHLVRNHYHPIALCYDIAFTPQEFEHISQKEYLELYSTCTHQDRGKEGEDGKSPFNVIQQRKESSNSFQLLKKRSGMFNRYSNSSQSLIQDDQLLCKDCNQLMPSTLIKCAICGKALTKQPSITSKDNQWQESAHLDQLPNVESSKIIDNDIDIRRANKVEQLRGGNCSGFKDSVGLDDMRQCETNGVLFDRSSSTEAEKSKNGDDKHEDIKKKATKEIMLSSETAEAFVLKSPPKKQIKPQYNLIKHLERTNPTTNPSEKSKVLCLIKPLEKKPNLISTQTKERKGK